MLCAVLTRGSGVVGADADAAAAADALIVVDDSLSADKADRAVRAVAGALAAAAAQLGIDDRLAGIVLLHLARAGAAAHAGVLQRAAEARLLMALEVVQGNKDVRVHDRAADLRILDIFAAHDRDLDLVGALEAVGDDDLTSGGQRGEAVFHCGVEMLQRVLSAADVERVAVGQKRHAAEGLDDVRDGLGEIRAQEREVARLAEMCLDRDHLMIHVDLADPGAADQSFQLLLQVVARLAAHVREENL